MTRRRRDDVSVKAPSLPSRYMSSGFSFLMGSFYMSPIYYMDRYVRKKMIRNDLPFMYSVANKIAIHTV